MLLNVITFGFPSFFYHHILHGFELEHKCIADVELAELLFVQFLLGSSFFVDVFMSAANDTRSSNNTAKKLSKHTIHRISCKVFLIFLLCMVFEFNSLIVVHTKLHHYIAFSIIPKNTCMYQNCFETAWKY